MKETIFKFERKVYSTGFYQDFNNIEDIEKDKFGIQDVFNINPTNTYEEVFLKNPKVNKDEKLVIFTSLKKSSTKEEDFQENYGNPLCMVTKHSCIVVVERDGDKVCMKLFTTHMMRRVGQVFFRKTTNCQFITFDKKTSFIYSGNLTNYHKKRKCGKRFRKNIFYSSPINNFLCNVKNSFYTQDNILLLNDLMTTFYVACGLQKDLTLSHDDVFYKSYLDKMGVKYPNNFSAYRTCDYEQLVKLPELRKNGLKMVDTFMKKNSLSGKVLKTVLHECKEIHLPVYKNALMLFGEDMMNNDMELTKECLENTNGIWFRSDIPLKSFLSTIEVRNIFSMFRQIIIDKEHNLNTLWDHLRFYIELKDLGEPNIKWTHNTCCPSYFQEHLNWSDKISEYRQGKYTRIYPEKFATFCGQKISYNGEDYYPVLLTTTSDYSEESQTQSNCVKSYIGNANAIIFSLRKGSTDSRERATVEYRLNKQSEDKPIWASNVQHRLRFNDKPTEDWVEVIRTLNTQVQAFVWGKDYENVKLIKECKNGTTLSSDSIWEEGRLTWDKKIVSYDY